MKISQFPLIESVDGSEQLAIVKDGANGKMKTSAIIAKAKEGLVPQIAGKGLSTNDYTDADKTKLDALPIKAELDTSLASKQPAITASDDIAPLGSDKLALTDKAKMAELIATAKAAGATYNNSTHYFELNGLTDITAKQMRNILEWGTYERFINVCDCDMATVTNNIPRLRTTIPSVSFPSWRGKSYPLLTWMPQGLEIIKLFVSGNSDSIINLDNDLGLYDAPTLRCILDILRPTRSIRIGSPLYPTALSTLYIKDLKFSIDLARLSALSLSSLQYLVTNSANTDVITVTVHPDVYAKLTGDTSNAAAAALSADELAQWQALVATASARKISFASA